MLANDIDVDGDALSVAVAGAPEHGTVVANEDGTITYTPDGTTGTDSFGYTISDGTAASSATVSVNVAVPVQHPLTLEDFSDPQIHVTPTGDVYVVGKAFIPLDDGSGDGYDKMVGLLNADGSITPVVDVNSIVPSPYNADVAIGPDGRVYVLNNGWYNADGTLTVYGHDGSSQVILNAGDLSDYGVDLNDGVHLAVGNDGKIYITAWTGMGENAMPSALTVLNADGSVAVAPVDLGFAYASVRDLVVGADGLVGNTRGGD